jgi:hypothetical protein
MSEFNYIKDHFRENYRTEESFYVEGVAEILLDTSYTHNAFSCCVDATRISMSVALLFNHSSIDEFMNSDYTTPREAANKLIQFALTSEKEYCDLTNNIPTIVR